MISRTHFHPHARRAASVFAATAMLFAACSSDDSTTAAGPTPTPPPSTAAGERGWLDGSPADAERDAAGASRADGDRAALSGAASAPGADRAAEADDVAGGGGAEAPQSVGLRAGSVDDNEAWDDYLLYRERFEALGLAFDRFDVAGRHVVDVTGPSGPVLGAHVEVLVADEVVYSATTRADGRAVVFAPAGSLDQQQPAGDEPRIRVRHGDAEADVDLGEGDRRHAVTLDTEEAGPAKLDLHFLIDATGSMGDEIERLKASLKSVLDQIDALPASPDVRLSLTAYRDEGDAYVSRTFDFTSDVEAFASALDDVSAGGGGDYAEALNEALADAVAKPAWRGDDTVKLSFLIADAPPHVGRGTSYVESMQAAAANGIAVFPVASSGLDDQGEYVFRQVAQATQGRFVFLTYGADGVSPGDETPHDVDDYAVLSLDELIVSLVGDELDPLAG